MKISIFGLSGLFIIKVGATFLFSLERFLQIRLLFADQNQAHFKDQGDFFKILVGVLGLDPHFSKDQGSLFS